MTAQYALRVGLDWAEKKHDLMVLVDGADSPVHRQIESAPESIDRWLAEQRLQHPRGRFAVCLEQSRGALCYALMKYDFVDLYPANPATLAKYRQAFAPSRSKNDKCDAELLLELLVKHADRLRKLEPESQQMRKLTLLCQARRKEVDERTRLVNRLQSLLKDYYPQAPPMCGEKLYSLTALDFLERWETFQALGRARKDAIVRFYKTHRASERKIAERLETVAKSCSVTDDPAIVETAVLRLRALVGQIRVLNQAIEGFDEEIAKTHPQADNSRIFESFPGAGKALAPRLCCAFGANRARWQSAQDFQNYSGVAPVTERSGNSRWVHWRWSCPKFLRQTLVEYAQESRKRSAWAQAFYERQKEKGKGHNTILRALAYKWVRVMYRCWQNRESYDEDRYLRALRANGAPLQGCCQA